jgi:hypothetical protein
MSTRKPLVLDDTGNQQQLQSQDEIPLSSQVEINRININLMASLLQDEGFVLPDELTQNLD